MLHEVKFESFNERDTVYGWIYVPACEPKGIVQLIHGFGEHSRRYFHMIVRFMEAGYIVAADDHVGHGKTALENDTWGNWGDKGCHTMMEDEHRMKKIACEIYVYVKYFNSPEIINWGIPLKGNPDYPGVIIKAVDLKIPPEIEVELREKEKPFIGATYTFNQETKKFTMETDSGIFKEGTYEWNITSLTLMYDNKTEKFGFKFATGMSYGYILQSDKIVEYQQRYPDAGITEVKVNYIWKDNGIIQLGGLTF